MTSQPVYSSSGTDPREKATESPTSDNYTPEFERKTMRYVDWRIIPVLAMIFSFATIDRINLGSAYAAGMGRDLDLAQGGRFNLVVCIFFVPYTLLQLPGNLLLRKFGVRNWLAFIVISYGAVQLGMGFINVWPWLVFCRILLGALEASLLPAILFVMTTWYTRHEVQLRIAALIFISAIVPGLGPILAYGCTLLDGKGKLAGWRWIFVIEGLITFSLGVVAWFFIPSFPDQNDFLTPEQTKLVLKRIDEDRGDAIPDAITTEKVMTHMKDWTLWAHGIICLCSAMPGYSLAYFLPIILKDMGWSQTKAILLSAPPSLTGVLALLVGYLSDKYRHRSTFIALPVFVCMTGISLLAFSDQNAVRYTGAFFTAAGTLAAAPAILAYAANNVVSHSKRSVQTAVQLSCASVGAIIATVVFRAEDAPQYIPGLGATFAFQALLLMVLSVTTWHFARLNKLMREGKLEKPLEGRVGFYYTL